MALIEVSGLSVFFGPVAAVQDVSFTVTEGESYGIVGESGSGKSTVLRAICGLAPISGGTVRVGGEVLQGRRPPAFYRNVQMVFQDPYASLHPRHTVDKVLSEPLAIHGFDDAEARVERALDDVGLGRGFRFRYPHQLSGGQRQRVGVARAIALNPALVVADEIVSGLDVSVQAQILQLLQALRSETGMALVLISHDLSVVRALCEKVVVMQHGVIVESGLSAEVFASPQHPYTKKLLRAIPLPEVDPAWIDTVDVDES